MNIQWYPGHMAKTKRLLQENIKLVDIIIELLDARVPTSSVNPEFDHLFNQKNRILVLNKVDLADPNVNLMWKNYYQSKGITCVFVNSQSGQGIKQLLAAIDIVLKEKYERDTKRGLLRRPIKAMVVGIPNVGKSTFINKIVKKASTRTGDRPGVTRNKQWIKINQKIHFLDTPGILWPKFDNQEVGLNLAFTGAIKDQIMNVEELACQLIGFIKVNYPDSLKARYNIDNIKLEDYAILDQIAINRNYYISSTKLDLLKMSTILLDEFRGGKLGKISLEKPI